MAIGPEIRETVIFLFFQRKNVVTNNFMYICVGVCENEGERERKREGGRNRKKGERY